MRYSTSDHYAALAGFYYTLDMRARDIGGLEKPRERFLSLDEM